MTDYEEVIEKLKSNEESISEFYDWIEKLEMTGDKAIDDYVRELGNNLRKAVLCLHSLRRLVK